MKLNLKTHTYPGKLITFCGLDGSGKTTYINKITELFAQNNRSYVITKQPTEQVRKSNIFRTYMDQADHSAYDYRALSLFAASDRLQHTNTFIVPNLRDGITVFSDRYFYSCLANLRARGYKTDTWIYEIGSHLIEPDVALFFDVDAEIAIQRVRSRPSEKDRYIDVELQKKLREEYLYIAQNAGGIIIDTTKPFCDCYNMIMNALKEKKIYV